MSEISTMPIRFEERQFFAVRCCCQPTKVLGFLLLPKQGGGLRAVVDWTGRTHNIQIKTIMNYGDIRLPDGEGGMAEAVRSEEQAIYSEDRGLEFWRSVVGFMPVVTADFVSALMGKGPSQNG